MIKKIEEVWIYHLILVSFRIDFEIFKLHSNLVAISYISHTFFGYLYI